MPWRLSMGPAKGPLRVLSLGPNARRLRQVILAVLVLCSLLWASPHLDWGYECDPGIVEGHTMGLQWPESWFGYMTSHGDSASHHHHHAPPPAKIPRPHLPASRVNPASKRAYAHVGRSRVEMDSSDKYTIYSTEPYTTAPLPSLHEAFAHLEPRLTAIKNAHAQIPQEHVLTEPIFPPFLTRAQQSRYAHLQEAVKGGTKRYLVVTVCRQVAGMLADWFAAWTVLADFLGPETLVFSLHEGISDDGSGEILAGAMRAHLLYIGVPPANIHIVTGLPRPNWEDNHRIALLASMRNGAMAHFYNNATSTRTAPDGTPWTAVVFHNDVYFSAAHVLELVHQHVTQDADMTCGWDQAGKWFYDGWVGCDMAGDLFTPFPVPEEEEGLPQKLFVSSPATRERHQRRLPYQVFSCWDGMAVLSPTPFLPPYNVRFRRGTPVAATPYGNQPECHSSEAALLCWDFWRYGFGRIQVVPGARFVYAKGDARLRGYLELPDPGNQGEGFDEKIAWVDEPPDKVRCHDWPDAPGLGHWAWDSVRWVDSPKLETVS